MSADPAGFEMTWARGSRPGLIDIVVRVSGLTPFTHAVNISNDGSRESYLVKLLTRFPGIDRDSVAAQLEGIAAELVLAANETTSTVSASPERAELLSAMDEESGERLEAMSDEVRDDAMRLLHDPRLVELILGDISAMGVVGEQELSLATYLILISRLLPKPLAAIIQALSSSGKSYVINRVGLLVPEEGKIVATDITMNALYYLPTGSLMHKAVLAGERRRGGDDEHANVTRALREMIESGELRKVVPIKGPDGKLVSQNIWQPGPISYIESTTNTSVFDEDANRALLLNTDESAEQTARIVAAQARAATNQRVNVDPVITLHHALQRMLKRVDVQVPFASAISDAIPTHIPQARRVMPQIISVIRASALLHQHQRSSAALEHGDTIDASIQDYVIARRLLVGPLGRALGGALPTAVSAFAARLRSVFGSDEFSSTDALGVDPVLGHKSKINAYLNALANAGVADCVQTHKGQKPATWRLIKEVPPGGAMWLPTVEDLNGGV